MTSHPLKTNKICLFWWLTYWSWCHNRGACELSANRCCDASQCKCTRPFSQSYILLKLDSNHRFFSPCDLEIWWMTWKNYRAPLLHYTKLCASFQIHWWIQIEVTLSSGQSWQFFVSCAVEISWMTFKNNRAPLLCYVKLCASFQSHRWIKTVVTVRKRSIWVKIGDFLSRVTLKFAGWPWKTIGHLFYVASSFVHHFIAISEFKLKLQSGNAQFGSNLKIGAFLFRVTLKFHGWPWKTLGYLSNATWSFVHHFKAIGEFKLELRVRKCSIRVKLGQNQRFF